MRNPMIALAALLAAVTLANPAQAQKSNWSVEIQTRVLGDRPADFNERQPFNTLDQESEQAGVVFIDTAAQPELLRIGVVARITTDGSAPAEGLGGAAPDGFSGTVLGLQAISAGVHFSGTGAGASSLGTAPGTWRDTTLTTTLAGIFGGTATGSAGVQLNRPTPTSEFYQLFLAQATNSATWKGVWCGVESGANSCDIWLGILEIPTADLPADLETFAVAAGASRTGAELLPSNLDSWSKRANIVAAAPGAPATYNFCSGTACAESVVTFAADAYSVSEGNGSTPGTVDVAVNYGGMRASEITLTLAVSAPATGTAAPSTDYAAVATSVTIPAGSGPGQEIVTVTTVPNDTPGQGNRAFVLTMSTTAEGVTLQTTMTTVTIVEDDLQDMLTVAIDTETAAEDAGATTVAVTVTLDRQTGTSGDLSVTVTLGGTADSTDDYTQTGGLILTIAEGADPAEATASVVITPTDDSLIEGPETILFGATAAWAGATDPTVPAAEPATFTITDNDSTTVAIARKAGDTDPVAEGGNATFTATFAAAVARATISWPANPDLGATEAVVTDAAAATAVDFTIPVNDDNLAEAQETMDVAFSVDVATVDDTDGATAGDQNNLSFNIAASDPITITVTGPDTLREGDSGDYVATLSGGEHTADVMVTIDVGTGGTGQAADVTLPTTATQTIAVGLTSATFSVAAVDDGFDAAETDETIEIAVSGTGGADATINAGSKTTTISQLPAIDIAADATAVPEGEDAGFTLSLSSAVDEDVLVDWTVANGTTSDADFSDTSGTVTFPANNTDDQPVSIGVVSDGMAEANETFTVVLTFNSASAALDTAKVVLGAATSAAVTVNDTAIEIALSGPAKAREGADAVYTVRITNGVETTADITVDVTLDHGTTSSVDFGTVPPRATIPSGELSGTFAIPVVEEDTGNPEMDEDPDETFTVTISNATMGGSGTAAMITTASVDSVVSEGSPEDNAKISTEALVAYGSALSAHIIGVVEGRASAEAVSSAVIGGTSLSLGGTRTADESSFSADNAGEGRTTALAENVKGILDRVTEDDGHGGRVLTSIRAEELIPGSEFQLQLSGNNGMMGAGLALWGQISLLNYEREPEDNDLVNSIDGKSTTGTLGVEFRPMHDMIGGVALVHSRGDTDFSGDDDSGTIESTLTMLQPYGHWKLDSELSGWATLGYGRGDMEYKVDGDTFKNDLDAQMLAGGIRQDLMSAGGFDWAAKADASYMKIGADGTENVASFDAVSHRLRAAVEGRTNLSMEDGAAVTGIVELGARWDGGDGDNGAGAEVGAGINYSDPSSGFSIDARVRMLALHQIDGLKEWGASVTAKIDPGADGRGLKLSVAPSMGDSGSGIDSLLGTAQAAATDEEEDEEFTPQMRLNSEIGYGFGVFSDLGTFTPTGSLSLSDNSSTVRVGGQLEVLTRHDVGFNMDVYNEREFGGTETTSSLVLDGSVERKFGSLGSVRLFNKLSNDDSGEDYEVGLKTQISF